MQKQVAALHFENASAIERGEALAVEEPLEIRVNGESLTVTMRTPGDDFALIAGFLFAESLISSASDIRFMGCVHSPGAEGAAVDVTMRPGWQPARGEALWSRSFPVSASCGVCGKDDLRSIACLAEPLTMDGPKVAAEVIYSLPARMREAQSEFNRTGGLHAAGLFDCSGKLLSLYEDVGRHNAVDKLVGAGVLARNEPLSNRIMQVSGRLSYELIQKSAMAGIPVVCAVSAPSSLAVELAESMNITIAGFVRGQTMNVYTCRQRICGGPST